MTAFNFTTMTEYAGSNATLAGNGILPAFATFMQLRSAGYSVKKGAKSIAINCGFRKIVDKETKKEKTIPRFARVFDIADTSANDDKDFMAYLQKEVKAGRIKRSALAQDVKIAKAMAGASE